MLCRFWYVNSIFYPTLAVGATGSEDLLLIFRFRLIIGETEVVGLH
jgi:hypothetical protein